jgi:exosortase family protein XrtG
MSPSAGQILAASVLWVVLVSLLWRKRRWLSFYVTGALGFVLLSVFLAMAMGWDTALEALQARQVTALASNLGHNLETIGLSGLAIENHVGWAVFDVGIECSALLEMTVFMGLVGFYPAFTKRKKTVTITIGLIVTYLLNLARILLIISIIAALGTGWVYAAHAVFGRVFFFVFTLLVYWYLVTRPTVKVVGKEMARDEEGGQETPAPIYPSQDPAIGSEAVATPAASAAPSLFMVEEGARSLDDHEPFVETATPKVEDDE